MSMKAKVTIGSLFLLGLAACGGGADAVEPAPPATAGSGAQAAGAKQTDDPSCPVAVPGTSVAVQDAEGGAALVFTTTGDVASVRQRAREMARMHNEMHAKMGPLPTGDAAGGGAHGAHDHGAMGGDKAASGGDHSAHTGGDQAAHSDGGEHSGHAGGMVQIHSHAVAEDIDGGVRVVFHPDPKQQAALRDELTKHAQHLSGGRCGMNH
jgi:hypothetical protein